jgi:hypothetical protein
LATNKTEFLNLNDWVGTDPFKREEINANFRTLDAKAKEHDDELLQKADKSEVATLTTSLAENTKQFQSTVGNESPQFGAELLDATGWTSTGWTGDFNSGFIHTVGQITPLTKPLPSTGTKLYQVALTVTSSVPESPPGNFTVSIGGSQTFDTYKGAGTTPYTYSFGIQSVTDGNLVITPVSGFNGSVTNISVKEIIAPTLATQVIKDSTNANSLEIRPTKATLKNVFIGNDAGKMHTTGDENTIVGNGSMVNNTSGFWNSALGSKALANNTVGSRNIAIGRVALQHNITGHRNIAVGTFSLEENTHGANNVGVGADSLNFNTTGNGNVGIGTVALYANTTGSNNIALGYPTLQRNLTGSHNIGMGSTSLDRNISGNGNVAIGKNAGERVNADNNIAIGQYALNWVTTTSNSIAIGYQSQMFTTAAVNISIGANSLYNTTTGTDNVGMGDNSLKNNTTGIRNIAIGNNAGTGLVGSVINRNIIIGHNAGTGITTGADNNVIIGSSSGVPLTTGANNILIGYAVNTFAATDNNFLNIGNAIKGWLDTKKFGIGIDTISATLHLKGGSTTAGSAPLKLNSGSLMTTPEAGAIEFDGTDLWITTNGGVRKKITAA